MGNKSDWLEASAKGPQGRCGGVGLRPQSGSSFSAASSLAKRVSRLQTIKEKRQELPSGTHWLETSLDEYPTGPSLLIMSSVCRCWL